MSTVFNRRIETKMCWKNSAKDKSRLSSSQLCIQLPVSLSMSQINKHKVPKFVLKFVRHGQLTAFHKKKPSDITSWTQQTQTIFSHKNCSYKLNRTEFSCTLSMLHKNIYIYMAPSSLCLFAIKIKYFKNKNSLFPFMWFYSDFSAL